MCLYPHRHEPTTWSKPAWTASTQLQSIVWSRSGSRPSQPAHVSASLLASSVLTSNVANSRRTVMGLKKFASLVSGGVVSLKWWDVLPWQGLWAGMRWRWRRRTDELTGPQAFKRLEPVELRGHCTAHAHMSGERCKTRPLVGLLFSYSRGADGYQPKVPSSNQIPAWAVVLSLYVGPVIRWHNLTSPNPNHKDQKDINQECILVTVHEIYRIFFTINSNHSLSQLSVIKPVEMSWLVSFCVIVLYKWQFKWCTSNIIQQIQISEHNQTELFTF